MPRFMGGRTCFDNGVYKEYMKVIQEAAGSKQICFFLCSDEKIERSAFDGFEVACFDVPAAIEDVYALSQCDYIIGPPSHSFYVGVVHRRRAAANRAAR